MSSSNKQLQDRILELERQLQYVSDIPELISELEKLMTEKIEETHKVQGMQSERHAYMYYRSILWKIRSQYKTVTAEMTKPLKC